MDGNSYRPQPPSSSLPPLRRLDEHSFDDIEQALRNLRGIFCPLSRISLLKTLQSRQRHKGAFGRLISEASTPILDSGYASGAEEDDDLVDNEHDPDILRSDTLERAFAIKWLTTFIARSEEWTPRPSSSGQPATDEDRLSAVVEDATCVLASFADSGEDADDAEGAVTRTFSFPVHAGTSSVSLPDCAAVVEVTLNDAPLSDEDHTSVGLQSWGASIVLAERICADPARFGFSPDVAGVPNVDGRGAGMRILELGAGTGLLSLVLAKLLSQHPFQAAPQPTVVATDYHQDVLANLQLNMHANFPSPSTSPVAVHALDWSLPSYDAPFDRVFNVVIAADVVYHVEHAAWIRGCVARLLAPDGIFWLIIPLRSIGRHEGVGDTVDRVFPPAHTLVEHGAAGREPTLAVLEMVEAGKQKGVGRTDEGGYKLFKIGWM